MTEKIQKAREALNADHTGMTSHDRRAVLDALDEAEANAKRVAELEQELEDAQDIARSGYPIGAYVPASKLDADKEARIAELEQELENERSRHDATLGNWHEECRHLAKRVADLEQASEPFLRPALEVARASVTTKDAEIARLRAALKDIRDELNITEPDSEDARLAFRKASAALAPATPEAKPAEPAKCVLCNGTGRKWQDSMNSYVDCDHLGATSEERSRIAKPPPAPEAAPERGIATAFRDVAAGRMPAKSGALELMYPEAFRAGIERGRAENADLRAQLAAVQAWLPGPNSMICTIAEWDRLWQERAAAQARCEELEAERMAFIEQRDKDCSTLGRLHREANTRADKAEQSMDELRRAVADLEGHDVETWPTHGNAPLAIAAGYALCRNERAAAIRERDNAIAKVEFERRVTSRLGVESAQTQALLNAARRTLAEAVELLRALVKGPAGDAAHWEAGNRASAFLARLSAAQGDES